MGSECSVEKDYELDEAIECSNKEWSLILARRKKDDFKVTVFIHEKKKKEKSKKEEGIAKAAQHLKVLKHPALVKHLWSYENSEEFCMVTEPVRPLESVIQTLDTTEIIAGLHNVVEALVFLHERGGLSHNNLCLASVYVSDNDWGWRLGGMEFVCKFSELTNEFLSETKSFRDSKSISPEEKEGQVNINQRTGHSLDAYAFGVFVSDILDTRADLGDAGETFGEKMQSLFLHENPQMRPQLSGLLNDDFFRSSFLEIMTFLNQITIKSEEEKEKFFSSVAFKLTTIPPKVVAKRMLPRLLSRFVLADPIAEKNFLPHLLTPFKENSENDYQLSGLSPILPEDLFREHCVPILTTLWSIRDGHVRMLLLKYFSLYATSFKKDVLENFILPQMLIGLRETDDRIVSATFSSLAVMVPILGANVVVGGERKKYFIEGRPKFKTSTTLEPVSSVFLAERKISNIGPSNLSGVIDIENRLSPLSESKELPRDSRDDTKKQHREKRRQEMEKRKEERKREMERRRLERAKEKSEKEKLSSPKRIVAETAVVSERDSDREKFEPWEDLDEARDSSLSDVTSGGSSSLIIGRTNSWSDDQSDLGGHGINNVDVTSSVVPDKDKFKTAPSSYHEDTSAIKSTSVSRGSIMKLGAKKTSNRTRKVKNEYPGSEYDILQIGVQSNEPDYFADMEPTVKFTDKDAKAKYARSQSAELSSKLIMVEDASQVESGWGDNWDGFD
ncbi:PREDICTED: protein-associating with the carboxyl-terminal domain of ezrin-like [Acropora digitifera]|uniref:protein-associating with the carboxyl-terminal domain of ezrin-like n=1 Tax=Acropora digitifera TaxID=70779 RepID=UPI00077A90B2|nr:PREDICTED: protein-associating with the carboxyl-terminal domain of ezrin-like [Acropora digitifera]